jgi:alcohol dehydrogenase YqhD (iron-dependent ADH family)
MRSPLMLPRLALVDPELTYDLPPEITASTGLDALTQLVEPYTSNQANPIPDALCLKGMRCVARLLATAFRHGDDAAAREDMALASLFGGLALNQRRSRNSPRYRWTNWWEEHEPYDKDSSDNRDVEHSRQQLDPTTQQDWVIAYASRMSDM